MLLLDRTLALRSYIQLQRSHNTQDSLYLDSVEIGEKILDLYNEISINVQCPHLYVYFRLKGYSSRLIPYDAVDLEFGQKFLMVDYDWRIPPVIKDHRGKLCINPDSIIEYSHVLV